MVVLGQTAGFAVRVKKMASVVAKLSSGRAGPQKKD